MVVIVSMATIYSSFNGCLFICIASYFPFGLLVVIGTYLASVRRITSLDTPVAFAPALEDYTMPKVEEIIQAVRELTEF